MGILDDDNLGEKVTVGPKVASPATSEPVNVAKLELEDGVDQWVYRRKWYQLWVPRKPPSPPRKSLLDAPIIPIQSASLFSLLTYQWINPLITLGYQRPLQVEDLWKVDESREAGTLSIALDQSWDRRVLAAKAWNIRLQNGEIAPGLLKKISWALKSIRGPGPNFAERLRSKEDQWRKKDGLRSPSLAMTLNDVMGLSFWAGGLYKVAGDTASLMGPLVSKAIINFGKERMAAAEKGTSPPNIGRGIAMAIGMFFLVITTSVCTHQFFWRSMTTGVLARAAMISSIYKRGMKLSPKARSIHTNASLVNHISTDVSRIDYAAQWFHAIWTAPIQVSICLALLLVQLGPSALAGFSVFVVLIPIQKRIMAYQFTVRKSSMIWTDQRASLFQELLSAMRVIKYFCYEVPFQQRISQIRHNELIGIRRILFIKAANQAIAFSVPALASVLAFVTYALLGKPLDPAVIFTSLSLFQLLRQPLMFLPRALSAWTDARNAIGRLTPLFLTETLGSMENIDPSIDVAVLVQNADFEWESISPDSNRKQKGKKPTQPKDVAPRKDTKPFAMKDVNFAIPRGQLCAITGAVGAGKSSLLSGLLGDMKKTRGEVKFGGRVGYCAQTAWIQNASLRDNIIFGAEWDEDKYWDAVQNSSLISDLEMLPDGDLTEIGEKGINLSGGQKQRVNIARALYNDADIVIMDDPLSAVDAHVGKALFADAILKGLRDRGKTIILVTHALHFLHDVDYIYNIVDGRIDEHGSYEELLKNNGPFARLLKEHGGLNDDRNNSKQEVEDSPGTALEELRLKMDRKAMKKAAGTGKVEGRLIKAEKRNTGAIANKVYSTYVKSGKGTWTLPLILLSAALMQGAGALNSYWLIWWQYDQFHQTSGFYMGLYATLGILSAVFTFALGGSMAILSFYACAKLHRLAVRKIFHAPMSFFDTTPLGRILGVFGKDIDVIDNQLADSLRMLAMTLSSTLGFVIIITYIQPYFIIAVVVGIFGYWYFAAYYSVSARELKRLDGNLRSLLYSHFSESLSGLSTIRAYGMTDKFVQDNEYFTDLEDRALLLTTTNQRWLAIRLDFIGAVMIFVVATLAATGVNGINPAQIGLILVYCVSLTQLFGMVTRQSAEVENYMNAVERVVHYTRDDLIQQEAPYEIEDHKPPPEWPSTGNLELRDIVMKYRDGLPPVLKGINLTIHDGEKIGVVGRTGAGKSSLMIALYRIVELTSGSIWLDNVDISTIGLKDLRSKISIIPQEPLLFSGTIRSNLDPFSQFEDSKLWDALRRAHLVDSPREKSRKSEGPDEGDQLSAGKFSLDTRIEAEGANLSVGQRSLLSLARALVRDEIRLVVLDEATASVDVETDSDIQDTISKEFKHKTLLCIAHRLRTIIHYDRVLVLDAGEVAEFGTPLELFKQEGIFRHLCDQSKITELDITPKLDSD